SVYISGFTHSAVGFKERPLVPRSLAIGPMAISSVSSPGRFYASFPFAAWRSSSDGICLWIFLFGRFFIAWNAVSLLESDGVEMHLIHNSPGIASPLHAPTYVYSF